MREYQRFVPQRSYPKYTFVPGNSPHPVRDPSGHSFGKEVNVDKFNPDEWQDSGDYLYAFDLFNAGFYWEAHEYWEIIWKQVKRDSVYSELLKGLIKLAAAGVKVYQGNENGVITHAQKAVRHFIFVSEHSENSFLLGLNVSQALGFAENIISDKEEILNRTIQIPEKVYNTFLYPVI